MDGLVFALVTGVVASISPTGATAAIVAASVGRRSSAGYLAGSVAARLAQVAITGLAALAVFSGVRVGALTVAPWHYITLGIVGATLAVSAAVSLARGGTSGKRFTEEDLHEPRIAFATGSGIVLSAARQWLFTVAVAARLGGDRSGLAMDFAAFAAFVAAANWVPLGLLAMRTIRPNGGERFFARVHDLTARHLHQLGPAIAIVVGAFLLIVAVDGYADLGLADALGTLLF